MTADELGSRLVFTNIFDDREFASAMGAGWHAGLERLHDYLDDRDPDQSSLEVDQAAWQLRHATTSTHSHDACGSGSVRGPG